MTKFDPCVVSDLDNDGKPIGAFKFIIEDTDCPMLPYGLRLTKT